MPGANALHVRIDSKSFGDRQVLSGIRFSVAPGEVVALLAPSGTGKTTTLRIVLGLDQAFDGNVERPSGRVGTVFQEPLLLPWMSVAANIRLVSPGVTRHEIDQLLARVGLAGVAPLLPRQLSLGMARRVAVARALSVRPALLVMDEPLASLDPMLAASISRSIIASAGEMNAVVLMATHNLGQALDSATRILILAGSSPATLALDLPASAVNADDLLRRFAFLRATEDGNGAHPQVG